MLEQLTTLSGLSFVAEGEPYCPQPFDLSVFPPEAECNTALQATKKRIAARNERLPTLRAGWRGTIFLPENGKKNETEFTLYGGQTWGEADVMWPTDALIYDYLLQTLLLLGFRPVNRQSLQLPEWTNRPGRQASAWIRWRARYFP